MENVFKPMLYQTGMVQSILDNLKKITRRTKGLELINECPDKWNLLSAISNQNIFAFQRSEGLYVEGLLIKCPWQINDVLWVRETSINLNEEHAGWIKSKYYYKTSHFPIIDSFLEDHNYKWIPSIHMKKPACRLFLRVKSIRVERLQSISEEDCIAEGVSDRLKEEDLIRLRDLEWVFPSPFSCYQFGFLALWCKMYGCESWVRNPWVWVVEFEKIDKPEDF